MIFSLLYNTTNNLSNEINFTANLFTHVNIKCSNVKGNIVIAKRADEYAFMSCARACVCACVCVCVCVCVSNAVRRKRAPAQDVLRQEPYKNKNKGSTVYEKSEESMAFLIAKRIYTGTGNL